MTLADGQRWTAGPAEASRCTQTVLMQFGIMDVVPHTGTGVLSALTDAGYTYTDVQPDVTERVRNRQPGCPTVARFCAEHPTGSYYLFSSGHAMALIDGLLVDSEEKGPNRRRVLGAYRISRSPITAPGGSHEAHR